MNEIQKQVMEKVKKLLALSQSPSEGEAAAAMQKAQILLAKHGLSMAEVDKPSDIQEEVLLEKKRLRKWESSLIYTVSKATFTEALRYRTANCGKILLIGKEVNTIAGKDLFKYLHSVILILGRAHSGQVNHVDSFRQGIVHRIGERLQSQQVENYNINNSFQGDPEDKAIIHRMDLLAKKENHQFISNKYGKTTKKKQKSTVDASSYNHGKKIGDSVSLNRQIN